ncbi:cysteine protease StiP domain-containing protein [Psychrobacter sp. I-STPA6b]|uniref:cysteine protease StiP domain-containing protein n=1 Tax=Psychrobacter sp. I-STPA6b TaxID=2585718 RepID=UPI001D0C53FF|nr:cysteine protease StiP domain-containing protein [Psychrobacter sp. I-STPA6b]
MKPTQSPAHLSTQSGSYLPDDVTFLLDIVDKDSINNVPVPQKEALIQSGKKHYSDMLTLEQAPSDTHKRLYYQALQQGSERMASDIANLAHTLHHIFAEQVSSTNPLILVSLVRAGLPIGVLLQRALQDTQSYDSLPSVHYGISIIRDRGLDPVAMQQILSRHPKSPIIFVDGWTGKGAIYGELVRSLRVYQQTSHPYYNNIFHQDGHHQGVIPLVTLADPAGVAWLSASDKDWLIPSGVLGCTVSGLISRTLFTEPAEDLTYGLHRSVLYHELLSHDCSLDFVQTIDKQRKKLQNSAKILPTYDAPRYTTQALIEHLAKQYQISNRNRIKPTIAEATRAILRRDPERVLLAEAKHPDTALLRHLCQQKNIQIDTIGNEILPYQAITIIKKC